MIEEHLRKHSLVDLAYKAIKQDIGMKKLLPGQKIIIRELVERYGTSETPIKQALNRLVTEGLVETILRKGMRVKEISWDWVEDSMEARRMIETFCARKAIIAVKSSNKLKEKFEKNLLDHSNIIKYASDLGNYLEHSKLDSGFHHLLVNCADNKKIIAMYEDLRSHLYMNYIYGIQKTSRMIETLSEHKEIWDALLNQDEKRLTESIDKHIQNGKDNMKSIFEELQKGSVKKTDEDANSGIIVVNKSNDIAGFL